jgi:glyoxylase-like metal-dependent hydrolase (beta-lactamase superfamily II)
MRRTSLFLIAALAACSSSSSSPAKEPTEPEAPAPAPADSEHVKHFKIGSLEAIALQDGAMAMPVAALFGEQRVAEAGELLAAAGQPKDQAHLSIQPLLVKTADHVLLFDTGTGGAFPGTGNLPKSMAEAGVAPGDVTDIFISHGHGDHIGGLVLEGALAFPNATIHLTKPEWAAIQGAAEDKELVAVVTSKVDAFEPGAQLLPEVKAVATPGHTPGHSSYLIGTGADTILYLGDIAHHHVISVQRPAWSIQFDGDHAAAEAMRVQVLAKLAAEHTRVYVVHFPFPGIGQVVDSSGTLTWQAE